MATHKIELPTFKSGSAVVYVDVLCQYETSTPVNFKINRVEEIPSDKRKKSIVHDIDTDDYANFRPLDMEQRVLFKQIYFMKLLGLEMYNEVLTKTWEYTKPVEVVEIPDNPKPKRRFS